MKHYYYSCDGGSIAIGNGLCTVCIPNDIGDGMHDFYVLEQGEKTENGKTPMMDGSLEFMGTCEGETEIYDYDCGGGLACTIEGRYGIYCEKDGGTFYFEKWDD